jgi:hypothetical protein
MWHKGILRLRIKGPTGVFGFVLAFLSDPPWAHQVNLIGMNVIKLSVNTPLSAHSDVIEGWKQSNHHLTHIPSDEATALARMTY